MHRRDQGQPLWFYAGVGWLFVYCTSINERQFTALKVTGEDAAKRWSCGLFA
jgi:hypothetical protein